MRRDRCIRCGKAIWYVGSDCTADLERYIDKERAVAGTVGPFRVNGEEVEAPACLECATDAAQHGRIVRHLGASFPVPPVCTAAWAFEDWERWGESHE